MEYVFIPVLITSFENGVHSPWQCTVSGVNERAYFHIKLGHLLTYKGMQPAKIDAIWCKTYSPGPFGLCATAVRVEELYKEGDEM